MTGRRVPAVAWTESENNPSAANAHANANLHGGGGASKRGAQAFNMLRCQSTVNLTGFGGFAQLYEPETSAPSPVACRQTAEEVAEKKRGAGGTTKQPALRAILGEITNTGSVAAPAAAAPREVAVPDVAATPELPDVQQYVIEYALDVLKSMLHRQVHFAVPVDYMAMQGDLNAKMRAILNDWLFEVHKKYGLRRETLFLSINIIDRYLSRRPICRDRLQLVGVAATLIAAKFEEIHPPEVSDLIYVTACTYSRQDILDMEMAMLGVLNFQVAVPTPAHFLSHYQAACKTSMASDFSLEARPGAAARNPFAGSSWHERDGELAWYILELSILDIRMLRFAPSHLAASALLLSNAISGHAPVWPADLARASGHPEAALRACVGELRGLLTEAPSGDLQAVQNHYRHAGGQLVGDRAAGGGSGRRS